MIMGIGQIEWLKRSSEEGGRKHIKNGQERPLILPYPYSNSLFAPEPLLFKQIPVICCVLRNKRESLTAPQ